MPSSRVLIQLIVMFASLSGALAVIAGAFGAHALAGKLSPSSMSAYETAVQYQFLHTMSLLILGVYLLTRQTYSRAFFVAGVAWMVGIVLFCGSLYGLALGGPRWLGPVTPLGGLCLILAWLSLAVGFWRLKGFAE